MEGIASIDHSEKYSTVSAVWLLILNKLRLVLDFGTTDSSRLLDRPAGSCGRPAGQVMMHFNGCSPAAPAIRGEAFKFALMVQTRDGLNCTTYAPEEILKIFSKYAYKM